MRFELFTIDFYPKDGNYSICLFDINTYCNFFGSLFFFAMTIYGEDIDFDWDFLFIHGIIKWFRYRSM